VHSNLIYDFTVTSAKDVLFLPTSIDQLVVLHVD